jgi:HEPN domain-containing protein
MKGKIDLTKLWIKKAENDLITAKNSLNIKPEPPLDTICFHAQQCAEKYLKAFLVYHEIEFEKIHDITELILLASQVDKSFLHLIDLGKKLTPYAVEIRYPGMLTEELTEETAREAVNMAIEIKEFVLARLPLKEGSKKND